MDIIAPNKKRRSKTKPQDIRPKYIRVPASGECCPATGLTRSAMLALVLPSESNRFNPPVKSKSVKIFGDRGVRLVDFDSLVEFIERQGS